jgi:hypothetical protein
MTGLTVYALGNVSVVIEVYKVREHMNASPLDRSTAIISFTKLLNVGLIRCHLKMTVHAR